MPNSCNLCSSLEGKQHVHTPTHKIATLLSACRLNNDEHCTCPDFITNLISACYYCFPILKLRNIIKTTGTYHDFVPKFVSRCLVLVYTVVGLYLLPEQYLLTWRRISEFLIMVTYLYSSQQINIIKALDLSSRAAVLNRGVARKTIPNRNGLCVGSLCRINEWFQTSWRDI
jgi:hypothetical protein